MGAVSQFMETNYKHFNARETLAAAKAWKALLDKGGKMFITLAGAMSSAELGISLGQMIRAGKVHAISCTAANLEEDLFNLFDNHSYEVVPNWRELTAEMERDLRDRGFNRVTDTCIPETVMLKAEATLLDIWKQADKNGTRKFMCEYFFDMLDRPEIKQHFAIPAEHSWVLAAKEMQVPIFSPGFEDSTLANKFTAMVMDGRLSSHSLIKSGTEIMHVLAEWYSAQADAGTPVGFFQIGGGIAGDFPICTVPMLIQDLHKDDTPFWAYFCQISDAVTSYGGYSGANPSEKITWYKLDVDTPRFMINSDATIVAPLIFAYVMDW